MREQSVRTQRHITLDEIGRRIALGQFKELNVILKGDVDGSVEALSDSFSKLSTEEIQINIIHKGVERLLKLTLCYLLQMQSLSDLMSSCWKCKTADKEEIDIRYYSII
jgi:translation initiation factor IF-2